MSSLGPSSDSQCLLLEGMVIIRWLGSSSTLNHRSKASWMVIWTYEFVEERSAGMSPPRFPTSHTSTASNGMRDLSLSARTVDILKYHADGILGLAEGQTQLPRTLQNTEV